MPMKSFIVKEMKMPRHMVCPNIGTLSEIEEQLTQVAEQSVISAQFSPTLSTNEQRDLFYNFC